LKINPYVYHLNEGHSAFMIFELIEQEMKSKKIVFNEACESAKKQIVFTNHTLVAAGQEFFDIETIRSLFSNEFVDLGLDKKSGMFSMTALALNMSVRVNAVSNLHEKMAEKVWRECHIESITNGINIERWDMFKYYSHKEQKRKLIELIKSRCGVVFDENILLLGWARRFVDYKRPLALLGDVKRLKEMATKEHRKIQIVYSCPLNKTYEEENILMKKLEGLVENELKGIVTFIPNYDIEIAKLLTSGCDVWLNTPIVGCEACGTSGMKACLNGVLPLSTSDGWMDEVDISSIGWKVADNDVTLDLLDKIENEITVEYYNNKDEWKEKMKRARNLILEKFTTSRMLDEYIQKMYLR
ncbi:MAG: glycogen/starch/alpha-glucan phosphorylase, partial [Candidatus Taylorbacteria bacterium]|nr:glycogen/starch/alpha-glucan phosphorylase [Candidatus Taylorbacteria bacterium]